MRKYASRIVLACASVLFTLTALEGGFRVLRLTGLEFPSGLPRQEFDKPFYRFVDGILTAGKGTYVATAYSPDTNQQIYRATYTMGADGYRVTPDQAVAKEHAVFLGDSFTFGIGVSDRETLPFYYSRSRPRVRVYNRGFGGYGPNDLLLRARRENLRVGEAEGFIFYFHQFFHSERLLGGLRYVGGWGADHPYLTGEKGDLVFRGSFRESMPWWCRLGGWLRHSRFAEFFSLDWPSRLGPDSARFFAQVIDAIKSRYSSQLPRSRFLFVVAPEAGRDTTVLIPELRKLGIEVLDYSGLPLDRYVTGPVRIPLDGHYTARANQVLAKQLAADVAALR